MNIFKILYSGIFLLLLWGCEQKTEPVDAVPSEEAQEKKHERGYIDTH